MAKKTVAAKKRNVKVDANGQLHVHSSFNNIIVCLANSEGQVISWSSAGKMGFRGSKKNTPYAAQMAAQDCAKVAYDLGLRKVKAYLKGPGNGRESAVRTIHGAGIAVTEIIDVTPLPHNGCRPPKRRRVEISSYGRFSASERKPRHALLSISVTNTLLNKLQNTHLSSGRTHACHGHRPAGHKPPARVRPRRIDHILSHLSMVAAAPKIARTPRQESTDRQTIN